MRGITTHGIATRGATQDVYNTSTQWGYSKNCLGAAMHLHASKNEMVLYIQHALVKPVYGSSVLDSLAHNLATLCCTLQSPR